MSIRFFTQTIKSPKFTGAIAESSKGVSNLITDSARLNTAQSIVELGPGTGVFTRQILKKKDKNATFFAVELNQAFVEMLNESYPQVNVYHDTCENLGNLLELNKVKKVDRIVCGLPWTAFESKLQKKLMGVIKKNLDDGGIFVTFAYFPLTYLPAGRRFRKLLLKSFKNVETTRIVWLNLPPAFVYVCSDRRLTA